MPQTTENEQKIISLARDVLLLSRNTLLVNLRFLDMALSQLELVPIGESTVMTDAEHIYFNPRHVLTCYKSQKEIPVRDYLHMVLHCVFRHMYAGADVNRVYWDVACDIAVENMISELGLKAAAAAREQKQEKILAGIRKDLKTVTAEKIYHYLRATAPDEAGAAELRGLFYADNHEIWYMTADEASAKFGLPGQNGGNGPGENGEGAGAAAALQQTWQEISEKMQMDLETFSKQRGDMAGSMVQNLAAVNREKYDYTAFLRKFATPGEVMKINDDEFDYIFYTYGLKLYDRMPLIEPLEYKEVKRIREFVIAIDTSGSVAGDIVQAFVQKTYNILKSTESFFTRINLHILQCDAAIQEHVKITNQEEFDHYLASMQIHGLGGTDFRPVFEAVDKLIDAGEFTDLKGLIYFTDGYGVFPQKMPPYQTAFVFLDDDYGNPEVPPWAIKLVLQKNEI